MLHPLRPLTPVDDLSLRIQKLPCAMVGMVLPGAYIARAIGPQLVSITMTVNDPGQPRMVRHIADIVENMKWGCEHPILLNHLGVCRSVKFSLSAKIFASWPFYWHESLSGA